MDFKGVYQSKERKVCTQISRIRKQREFCAVSPKSLNYALKRQATKIIVKFMKHHMSENCDREPKQQGSFGR